MGFLNRTLWRLMRRAEPEASGAAFTVMNGRSDASLPQLNNDDVQTSGSSAIYGFLGERTSLQDAENLEASDSSFKWKMLPEADKTLNECATRPANEKQKHRVATTIPWKRLGSIHDDSPTLFPGRRSHSLSQPLKAHAKSDPETVNRATYITLRNCEIK
ncbi:hypothetical protein PSTT_02743 [Puccinia striiformis]|uniref:Uncharacterized protein n=1 Tax=Puccinia striiformis TaxID=27350 RepID=A0A2S4VYZ6_9BASI|nr:hypothetical protein PSTT_02743 [Puccinia striiformis]